VIVEKTEFEPLALELGPGAAPPPPTVIGKVAAEIVTPVVELLGCTVYEP
jgi:hypothetical protein